MLIFENESCQAFASTDLIGERQTGLGGSDIAAICGLDPFRSPLDVYCEKRGISKPIDDNQFLKWGRKLEPIIAEEFSVRSGLEGVGNFFLRSKEEKYLIVHPDRLVRQMGKDFFGVLECKNVGLRNSRGWTETEIPERVFLQIQFALMISGMKSGWVAALIDGNDYRLYDVAPDEEIFARVKSIAKTFWNRVQEGDAPAPTARERDAELIKRIYPHSVASTITVLDHTTPLAVNLQELATARDMAERAAIRVLELENKIKAEMKEKDTILFPDAKIKVTWKKTKDSTVTDWKKIVAELNPPSELVAKHSSVREGSRRFLFSQERDSDGRK